MHLCYYLKDLFQIPLTYVLFFLCFIGTHFFKAYQHSPNYKEETISCKSITLFLNFLRKINFKLFFIRLFCNETNFNIFKCFLWAGKETFVCLIINIKYRCFYYHADKVPGGEGIHYQKTRLKITHLKKVHFIEVNDLKLTQV